MEMKLKLFHDAKAPLANGHKRDSLLMMSDEEFESNHGFIQWAFPTAEKSNHNFNAPVLDLDSAILFAERNDVSELLRTYAVITSRYFVMLEPFVYYCLANVKMFSSLF